jgi:Flp pilus assembly protein TadB
MSAGDGFGPEREAPPAGEEVHLPGPTLIPFISAIAITLIVVGTTLGWIFSIVGLVILILTMVSWIRDTRRDVEALPEEHHPAL